MAVVVILVPWRGGDELREQSWEIVRPRLDGLGYPVITGDAPGPWARGRAINAAAREAGRWDIGIIADADTICDELALSRGIRHVMRTKGAARPHDRLHRLTPSGSIAFARGAALEERHIEGDQLGGGYLVIHRQAWDRIGGYDESFVGWGHEDTALNIALLVKADWDRLPGEAWHLWHPESRSRHDAAQRANRGRAKRLMMEHRDEIMAAERRKGWALGRVL
jgi:hypothetical protein